MISVCMLLENASQIKMLMFEVVVLFSFVMLCRQFLCRHHRIVLSAIVYGF